MLAKVRLALRISSNVFDSEISDLITAALADLKIAGAEKDNDPLIQRAVITYCRMNFGQPEDYDRLKVAYDEQKATLSMTTGYTTWG